MLPFNISMRSLTSGLEDLDTVEPEELEPVEIDTPDIKVDKKEEESTTCERFDVLSAYLTEEYYGNVDEFKTVDTNVMLKNTSEAFINTIKITPCPVYTYFDKKNSRNVGVAYITGGIASIDIYTELILVINSMSENDLLYIFIDSPGGSLSTGAAIASHITNCKGKVIGVARGFCASAASLIWSSCQVCIADICSVFLYHMSSHFDMGNSEDIRIKASLMITYVKENLLRVALEKGHITQEEYDTICNKRLDVIIPGYVMDERIKNKQNTTEEKQL